MTVYPRVELYLQEHQQQLYKLMISVGIDTSTINSIIIPMKDVMDEWMKIRARENVDEICLLAKHICAYLFGTVLDEKNLSSGQTQLINKASQICKFTKLTNGKFEIHSGPNIEKSPKIAECELLKEFQAAKDFKCLNKRPIAVAICKKGEISPDGIVSEKKYNGSSDDMEEEIIEDVYQSFEGGSEDAIKRKCENFELLMKKGNHAFTECIAGLLLYLEITDISEFEPLKKVVASLLTFNPVATYIVLFQPYGKNSFIPPRLMTDEWCFAPARSEDYVEIFRRFSKLAPVIDENARKTALREARSGITNVAMGTNFRKIYEQYFSKIYPPDFDLTYEQALWAHEALFKMCYGTAYDMFADTYRGEDYKEESTFTNPNYIKACVGSGLYSSDSLKCDCSPKGFVNSEYFLKYALVEEPSHWVDEMSKHSNPLDATARAFCQING